MNRLAVRIVIGIAAALCLASLPLFSVSASAGYHSVGIHQDSTSPSTDCLNNLVTYSGLNFVTGSEPPLSPACKSSGQSASQSGSDPFKIGVQWAAVLALIFVVVGAIVSFVPSARRSLLAIISGALAFVFLTINQSMAASTILNNIAKSAHSSSGSTPGFDSSAIANFFTTRSEIGYTAALVILAAVVLYNVAVLVMNRQGAVADVTPSQTAS